jgi:hypothetical protein
MLGVFEEIIESKTKMTTAKFHVAKGDNGNLLCSETAAELGLTTLNIHSVNKDKPEVNTTVKVPNEFTPEAEATEFIQSLTNEYQDLFRGIGCLKNFELVDKTLFNHGKKTHQDLQQNIL